LDNKCGGERQVAGFKRIVRCSVNDTRNHVTFGSGSVRCGQRSEPLYITFHRSGVSGQTSGRWKLPLF
jgi:hypothetical protein